MVSLARNRGLVAAVLGLVLLGSLSIVVGTGGVDQPAEAIAQEPSRPNVVVVQTDDQHLESLRVMPSVKRLLRDKGTTFKNYFATHPVCCPSRASYITGQYSHNHGVTANSSANGGGYSALDHTETLPVWLDREGYVTAHIGKYLNGYGDGGNTEIPPGWDQWYALMAGVTQHMYGYKLNENGRTVEYGGQRSDYQTDVLADKAVAFIGEQALHAQPFFLSVNPTAPHLEDRGPNGFVAGPDMPRNPRPAPRHFGEFDGVPLPKPPSFDERDVSDKPAFIRELPRIDLERRRKMTIRYRSRLESLLAIDDAVRDIVRELRSTGELANTVIVFVSDNGYFHGEHRMPGRKAKLYEEATRVPLVVRGPGFAPSTRALQVAGNVDLAPTILDVTGAESRGRTIDGRSLAPLAKDPAAGADRDLLLETGADLNSTGVRTSRYVYMRHASSGEKELYDLARDPFQLESRHADRSYNPVQRRLSDRLDQLEGCAGESCQ